MKVYLKTLLFLVGILGALTGIFNRELAPAIVSVGAFISYAIIETRDLKTLNDDTE